MYKKALSLLIITLALPVYANTTGLGDIEKISNAVNSKEMLASDSYAYKTLQLLYKKYGGVMALPQDKFKGTAPLSRNEAALILVNVLGNIEKGKIQLNEVDQERINAISDNLKKETKLLTARVSKLETTVDGLKDSNLKKAGIYYGKHFKIGGMFRGEFSTSIQDNVEPNKATSNFNIPVGMINLSGKPMEHTKYFVMINPNYKSTLGIMDEKQIIDRAYLQTDIIPHHKLTFGKQVVPILDVTSKYYSQMETTDYFPQIGSFGIHRQTGLKLAGKFKYLDYQTGVFSKNVANTSNEGLAYVARVSLKPLANNPEYGKLELGGSYYHSDKNTAYGYTATVSPHTYGYLSDRNTNAYSAYGKYKYKDFELISEFLHQSNVVDANSLTSINPMDSLNTVLGQIGTDLGTPNAYLLPASNVRNCDIHGWYTQASYFITPKMQLVGRFDTMSNDIGSIGLGQQYLAGVNYYFRYPNVRILANYILQDFKGASIKNKFIVQTQFLF